MYTVDPSFIYLTSSAKIVLVSLTLPGSKNPFEGFWALSQEGKIWPSVSSPEIPPGMPPGTCNSSSFQFFKPFQVSMYLKWLMHWFGCFWRIVQCRSLQHSNYKPLTQNFLRQNKIAPYNSLFLHKITHLVSASFCGLKNLVVKCLTLFSNQELFYYIVFVCSMRGYTREKQQALLHAIRAFRGAVPRGPGHTSALLETVTRRFVLTGWGFVQTSRFRESKVQAFRVCSVTVCREMSELVIYSKN